MTVTTLPLRSEVPQDETWNLESIYPNVAAWENAYKTIKNRLSDIEPFKGKLTQNPETLFECLTLSEEIIRGADKVFVYSGLDSETDASDQEALARSGQGQGLMNKAIAAVSFIEPELMTLGIEQLKKWIVS